MECVLVVGANGAIGKKIINLLKISQYFTPIAMVREREQVTQFTNKGVQTVVADLESEVAHTLKDADKIIFAAGSGGKKVIAVDQNGAKKMIDAAKEKLIKKFVMLSSMGADKPEEAEKLKDYLKAKQNADEHLKSSELQYTIVRPGSLTDDIGTGSVEIATTLSEQGSISREDVAQALVRVLHDGTAMNRTFEIISGETLIGEALDTIS